MSKPSKITNTDLLLQISDFFCISDSIYNFPLKPNLRENIDYKILNFEQWDFLNQKYGGQEIKRKLYKNGNSVNTEIYFQQINCVILPKKEEITPDFISRIRTIPIFCSQNDKMSTIFEIIVKSLKIIGEFRIWKLNPKLTFQKLCEKIIKSNEPIEFPGIYLNNFSDKSPEKCDISINDLIIIEYNLNEKNEFIFKIPKSHAKIGKCDSCLRENIPIFSGCKCDLVYFCSKECKHKSKILHLKNGNCPLFYKNTEQSKLGLCGLQNLGNTCFMNSALQCLSNTKELCDYFLDDNMKYIEDINLSNKLGYKGKFVKSVAKLIRNLWFGNEDMISPWEIKRLVGKYHSSFNNFAQQDSHEFISYILDGIHEDLNKNYQENMLINPDFNKDPELAWDTHTTKNKSIIVDLFHGQFKSEIVCQECSQISLIYEPFSSIQLQLQRQDLLKFEIYYAPYEICGQCKIVKVGLPKDSNLYDLINSLKTAKIINKLAFCAISNETIDKIFDDNEKMQNVMDFLKIHKSKLFAFEILMNTKKENTICIPINIYREFPCKISKFKLTKDRLSFTRFIEINSEINMNELQNEIYKFIKPFIIKNQISASNNSKLNEIKQEEISKLYSVNFRNKAGNNEKCLCCKQINCRNCNISKYPSTIIKEFILTYLNNKAKYQEYSVNFENEIKIAPIELELIFHRDCEKMKFDYSALNSFNSTGDNPILSVKNQQFTLDSCFSLLNEPEILDLSNKFDCQNCKKQTKAIKKLSINKIPKILLIQLKRFNKSEIWGLKDDSLVKFPISGLNLAKYLSKSDTESYIYDLYAVSNHYGGIGFGHYTAFAKNFRNEKWYKFDDRIVTEISENEIVSPAAYLLFYKRR